MAARKLIVVFLAGLVFGVAGIWSIAQWLSDQGLIEAAQHIRAEYLTGTAVAVILALLILLPDRLPFTRRPAPRDDRWPFD